MVDSTDPYDNVHSDNCDIAVHLRFFNKTTRVVDVYWANYDGDHVLYESLEPKEWYDIRTFVTHPWLFRDGTTGEPLVILPNHEFVCYPRAAKIAPNVRRMIIITEPLITLKDACIQKCLRSLNKRTLTASNLPATLQDELQETIRRQARYAEEDSD